MFGSEIEQLRGGLIVSCQAPKGSPLDNPRIIAALALVAVQNGAAGVRINGGDHIAAVRDAVGVPIIGIEKLQYPGSEVYITPDFASAANVARNGATMIALDATRRCRPGNEKAGDLIRRIRTELQVPVMADVATVDEVLHAVDCDADVVATTLCGFTEDTQGHPTPAFDLVAEISGRVAAPVICEGGLSSPQDVERAFAAGAFAVVVGAAITGVDLLVRRFLAATPKR